MGLARRQGTGYPEQEGVYLGGIAVRRMAALLLAVPSRTSKAHDPKQLSEGRTGTTYAVERAARRPRATAAVRCAVVATRAGAPGWHEAQRHTEREGRQYSCRARLRKNGQDRRPWPSPSSTWR